jgi:hypothetical protein
MKGNLRIWPENLSFYHICEFQHTKNYPARFFRQFDDKVQVCLQNATATVNFVMPVRPSLHLGKLSSHWTDFHEI